SALVRVSSTRSAPAASAVRSRVPTLPGSRTSWSTMTVTGPIGGSAASASATAAGSSGGRAPTATAPREVTSAPGPTDAARPPRGVPGRGLTDQCAKDPLVDGAQRHVGATGQGDQLGVLLGRTLGEVHLQRLLRTMCQQRADRLRSLDAEAPLFATRRAPGQR